jgi:hypothetical protein
VIKGTNGRASQQMTHVLVQSDQPQRWPAITVKHPATHGLMESTDLNRTLQLTQVRDWCMQRLSKLTLQWRLDDARALTSEHLETLEVVDAHHTLWMRIETGD